MRIDPADPGMIREIATKIVRGMTSTAPARQLPFGRQPVSPLTTEEAWRAARETRRRCGDEGHRLLDDLLNQVADYSNLVTATRRDHFQQEIVLPLALSDLEAGRRRFMRRSRRVMARLERNRSYQAGWHEAIMTYEENRERLNRSPEQVAAEEEAVREQVLQLGALARQAETAWEEDPAGYVLRVDMSQTFIIAPARSGDGEEMVGLGRLSASALVPNPALRVMSLQVRIARTEPAPGREAPMPANLVHPHVADGFLCMGTEVNRLQRSWARGDWIDLFLDGVKLLLSRYNPESRYHPLSAWQQRIPPVQEAAPVSYVCRICENNCLQHEVAQATWEETCRTCFLYGSMAGFSHRSATGRGPGDSEEEERLHTLARSLSHCAGCGMLVYGARDLNRPPYLCRWCRAVEDNSSSEVLDGIRDTFIRCLLRCRECSIQMEPELCREGLCPMCQGDRIREDWARSQALTEQARREEEAVQEVSP